MFRSVCTQISTTDLFVFSKTGSLPCVSVIRRIDLGHTNSLQVGIPISSRTTDRMSDNRRLPRVLCYGDSLTAGFTARTQYTGVFSPWAPHVADALSVPVIHHVGMCGWKTALLRQLGRPQLRM